MNIQNIQGSTDKDQFTTKQAFKLMDALVHRLQDNGKIKGDVANIGVVSGILSINEEIEVVVKFLDGLNQYTKSEFEESLILVDHNII
ncbi:MAG: hypothetical protein JKY88_16800 [Pseudomonadales bacterium]|nr:hypothetical protein [Pseudomonadales bacterium]